MNEDTSSGSTIRITDSSKCILEYISRGESRIEQDNRIKVKKIEEKKDTLN